MPEFRSRDEMLATVRDLRADLNDVVARAGEENALLPYQFGEWSLLDVIVHLTGWRELTGARLEAGVTGVPPEFPWSDSWTEDEVDAINDWFIERSAGEALEEVMADSDATFERVEQALRAIGDAALLEPGAVEWITWEGSTGLGPDVIRGTYEHHLEHMETIRPWLDAISMKGDTA